MVFWDVTTIECWHHICMFLHARRAGFADIVIAAESVLLSARALCFAIMTEGCYAV